MTTADARTAKRTAKSGDAKRTELKGKVDAAQKRNRARSKEESIGDYARDAGEGAATFVKEHPIATLAGGLALGILVASFLPGGRKVRKEASKRSAVLAAALGELALTYGTQFIESAGKAAKSGQGRLGDLGDTIGRGASRTAREAGSLADSAGDNARDIGRSAVKTLRSLRGRLPH